MKKFSKTLVIALVLFAFAAASLTAYAVTFSNPVEIISNLTGKSAEEITNLRFDSGKTFGAIAADEERLEEFKEEMLEYKKSFLDEKVKEGVLTQEEADEYYNRILERQENCIGTGGRSIGCGFGGRGMGGLGQGRGMGRNWQ
ncbi:DUF2680 domain-containing protein [Sedimentibacter sp.]|uniref:DUF2680 domain-containing protein n=1 Tax=Sedimentibacter sp. TaxID=1960295 RepID=UPI0028A83581|nr:DUF2680 domain-containing protein [Sedimentibacter sp.]